MTYQPSPNTRLEKRALTTNYTLKPTDSGVVFTNEGAAGDITITVPNGMPTGLKFHISLTDEVGTIEVIPEDGAQNLLGNSPRDIKNEGEVLVITSIGSNDYIVSGVLLDQRDILSAFQVGVFIERSKKTTWAWGPGGVGQVGDNTLTDRSSPVSVVGDHDFRTISVGTATSAIDQNGFAWCWGSDNFGNLGHNTLGQSTSSPVSVVGGHKFKFIAGGSNNSAAIDRNGFAWTWGKESSNIGELGKNTFFNSESSPVSVVGGHKFKQISVASAGMIALDEDGFAYSWGSNSSGLLGDNTTNNRSSPVSVVGGHVFKEVSKNVTSIALDIDGYAWCWGINTQGYLGDNTTNDRSSPVSVVGGHKFKQISSGNVYNLALDEDGFCWGWGDGIFGNLGNDSINDHSSPVSVVGGIKFSAIMAGVGAHGLGLEEGTGIIWGWGQNGGGQLGNNSIDSTSSPVSVVRMFNV